MRYSYFLLILLALFQPGASPQAQNIETVMRLDAALAALDPAAIAASLRAGASPQRLIASAPLDRLYGVAAARVEEDPLTYHSASPRT